MSGFLRTRLSALTDTGVRRKVNEDAVGVSEAHGVCVVCDGMGGHASGEVASRMAVDVIVRGLQRDLPPLGPVVRGAAGRDREAVAAALTRAIDAANAAVFERGRSDPAIESGRPMGTTVAALVLAGDAVLLAHIGDSRIYRVRGGELVPLTEDHSVTTSHEERRRGRKRKYVTRALGTRKKVRAELRFDEALPGDRYLLCSDGLTDCVADDEILAQLEGAADGDEAVQALVRLANDRGGRDNISVLLAALVSAEEPTGDRALGTQGAEGGRPRPRVERPGVDGPGEDVPDPPAPSTGSTIPGSFLTSEDMGVEAVYVAEPPPLEPPP
jgi:protein phosphatase